MLLYIDGCGAPRRLSALGQQTLTISSTTSTSELTTASYVPKQLERTLAKLLSAYYLTSVSQSLAFNVAAGENRDSRAKHPCEPKEPEIEHVYANSRCSTPSLTEYIETPSPESSKSAA